MAQSAVNIKVDTREFRQALKQIVESDKKGWAYVLNDQAFRLARAAMGFTKVAAKNRIEKLKRLKARDRKPPKNPRGRKRDDIKSGAFALYNAWRNRSGKGGGQASYDDVEEHFNRRQSSRGFIKAQWLRAMERVSISGKAFRKPRGINVRPSMPTGGWGSKAYKGLNPASWIGVKRDAFWKSMGIEGNPGKYLDQALMRAIPKRVKDMQKKLAERMNRVHRQHAGKGK